MWIGAAEGLMGGVVVRQVDRPRSGRRRIAAVPGPVPCRGRSATSCARRSSAALPGLALGLTAGALTAKTRAHLRARDADPERGAGRGDLRARCAARVQVEAVRLELGVHGSRRSRSRPSRDHACKPAGCRHARSHRPAEWTDNCCVFRQQRLRSRAGRADRPQRRSRAPGCSAPTCPISRSTARAGSACC